MNIKYKSFLVVSLLGCSTAALAQNEMDALRYSETNLTGTARSLSLGGAMGAVGGDASALTINPASIGVYRKSEFMITPTLKFNNVNANYLNSDIKTNSSKFSINNLGVVFSNPARGSKYASSKWKAISYGFTFNKLADYNQEGNYGGTNSESSMTEVFAEDAYRFGTDANTAPPFGFLAWNGFLVDTGYNSYVYNDILLNGGSVNQSKYWKNKGRVQEYSFTIGGNYDEKLMIGAGLNLTSYKYDSYVNYYEEDNTGIRNNNFDYMTYNEYLYTRGTGVSGRLGVLYNITPDFRFGINGQTPTWISFTDEADYEMKTNTENLRNDLGYSGTETVVRPDNAFYYEYTLRTPWKLGANAMMFIGNKGFVSFDYDFIGYNSVGYSFGNDYTQHQTLINNSIKSTFKNAHSFRLGAEARLDNFFLRAGAGHTTSPYENSDLYGGARTNASVGAGINMNNMSLHLAYVYHTTKRSEFGYPITYSNIPVGLATVKHNYSLLALTLLFKM